MRKLLSLVLALALVIGSFPLAFADAATSGAQLQTWKIVQGDLMADGNLTREMAITYFIRLLGEEAAALAYAEPTTFTDVAKTHWAYKYIAYAEAKKYTNGIGAGKFGLGGQVTTQQLAAFVVRGLGYADVAYADVMAKATELKLLTNVTATADQKINRGVGFEVLINTLNTPLKGQTVALKVVLGFEKAPVAVVPAKVKSAVALNSKTIEVTLTEAATAADVAAYTVKTGETAVAVTAAKFAPYSTTSKVVLLTVGTDLAAGTLYTVAAGDTKANFGGIAADTTKPTVVSVTSADYNEIVVTFSEAVDATKLVVTATEKYGAKAALTATYKSATKTTVTFTTADQKASTLYGTVIEGVTDFAGNVQVKDEAKTFVGTAKPTAKQTVKEAKVVDSKTVEVYFNLKADKVTAETVANYVVAEKYGAKTAVVVEKAELIAATTSPVKAEYVKLTLATDTKASTLYGIAVTNVKSLYDTVLDADQATTFVGVAPDTAKPSAVTAAAGSNTTLTLTFTDANGADNLAADVDTALVTVTEKYGAKTALTITKKEVVDNTIVFTTAAQKSATLYDVTVAKGIKDAKGNITTDALTTTFVGTAIAAKITSVTVAEDAATSVLTLTFDQNYGEGGLDVASYSIDGGIGYPNKVVAGATDNAVKITIPNTATGTLYKLTVKNVKNADGVAMDAAGITKTFVGTGSATPAVSKLEAAVAINNTTFKLYFNKDVADIAGLTAANMTITGSAVEVDTNALVYTDIADAKVLVVTLNTATDAADIKAAGKNATTGVYEVAFAGTGLDAAYNKIALAPIETDATKIKIDGIVAQDASTLVVYFNQAVRYVNPAHISVDLNGSTAAGVEAAATAVAMNTEKTQWQIGLTNPMTSTEALAVTITSPNTQISVGAAAATGQYNVPFTVVPAELALTVAGNTTAAGYIKDVYAVATDARTIVVYYPEAMNAAAGTLTNYTIAGGVTVIKATYSSTAKTTTLITDIDLPNATADLTINPLVKNAVGSKPVKKDATTNLLTVVARNTTTPAKVGIKSISTTGQVLTVIFDQEFKTSVDVLTAQNLIDLLTITLDNGGHTVATTSIDAALTIVKEFGEGNVIANSNANFIDRISVTIDASGAGGSDIAANQAGTVAFKGTVTVLGIKGQAATGTTAVTFVQE